MGGMFGNRGNSESREQTIANGEFHIHSPFPSLDALSSEPKDPASSNGSQAIGGGFLSCNSSVHSCCRTQVHEGPQEHERRRGVPIRRVQAKGDEELYAY